jgi:hypothetical protein
VKVVQLVLEDPLHARQAAQFVSEVRVSRVPDDQPVHGDGQAALDLGAGDAGLQQFDEVPLPLLQESPVIARPIRMQVQAFLALRARPGRAQARNASLI